MKVWHGRYWTHTQSFTQQRLKQVFLLVLYPTRSSSETEPSDSVWLTSRAGYIAEISLFKKKKNHNSSTLLYKPCTNKGQFSPCLQNYITRAWYFTEELRKNKQTNNKKNPNNTHGKSSINWREVLGEHTSRLPKNHPPGFRAGSQQQCWPLASVVLTHIQNTHWFSTVKRSVASTDRKFHF